MDIKKSKGTHESVALGYNTVDQTRSKFESWSQEEVERYFDDPDRFSELLCAHVEAGKQGIKKDDA